MGKRKWTEHDNTILKLYYATSEPAAIQEMLEIERKWHAIEIQASLLGLKRVGRKPAKSKYDTKAYCGYCKWIDRKEVKNYKCPKCGGRVRMPGVNSYRRKR